MILFILNDNGDDQKQLVTEDVKTIYLLENLHPHGEGVRVNLVQLVEVAEDHGIFRKTVGGTSGQHHAARDLFPSGSLCVSLSKRNTHRNKFRGPAVLEVEKEECGQCWRKSLGFYTNWSAHVTKHSEPQKAAPKETASLHGRL